MLNNKIVAHLSDRLTIRISLKRPDVLIMVEDNGGEEEVISYYYPEDAYEGIFEDYVEEMGVQYPYKPKEPKLKTSNDVEEQKRLLIKYNHSIEVYEKALKLYNERKARWEQIKEDLEEILSWEGFEYKPQ